MNAEPLIPAEYGALLAAVRERIRSAQYEALRAVNRQLVELYWDIGRLIVEQQRDESWGRSVVARLAKDLQGEFPGVGGFSVSNLWYMRKFYLVYRDQEELQPLAGSSVRTRRHEDRLQGRAGPAQSRSHERGRRRDGERLRRRRMSPTRRCHRLGCTAGE